MAGYETLGYAHKIKQASLITPLPWDRTQEYWQSLSYLPSTVRAGSDKIKAKEEDGKTQAMPKVCGKSQRTLNCIARSDPTNFY